MSGGQTFTKLDLQHAYQQLVLDEQSQQYLTVNTHRGLFQYTCLPFGFTSVPAIFQCVMETVLQSLPSVCVYIDDILVTGASEEEHLRNLSAVLQLLQYAGLRLKRQKCVFMVPEVEYLAIF